MADSIGKSTAIGGVNHHAALRRFSAKLTVPSLVDRIALVRGLLIVGRGADIGGVAGHSEGVFLTGWNAHKERGLLTVCQ